MNPTSGAVVDYGFDHVDPARLRAGHSLKWLKHDPDVLPAWIADMDFALAPPIRAVLDEFNACGVHGYLDHRITDVFLETFCERTNRQFGVDFQPSRVKLCTDIVQALYAAVFAFTAPSDAVLLLTPLYPPFAASVSLNGRRIVDHRMKPDAAGVWRFDPEELRAQIIAERPRIFMLCSPHNPVGRLWERAELECLAALAVEFDMLVIADEIHADLVLSANAMIAFSSLRNDVAERTVTITSANKAFNLAGLKVAQICFGDDSLLERFELALPGKLLGAVPSVGLLASTAAYRSGQPWLDAVCTYIRGNVHAFAEAMARRVPSVRVVSPEATYLSWLDFSEVPGVLLAYGSGAVSVGERMLREGRVAFNEGQTFGDGLEAFSRVNLATSQSIVLQIVDRVSEWVDAQSG